MTYLEIVNKLIGPINPIGETNTDGERFENLKALCNLTEGLIKQIEEVAGSKDRQEYSIKRCGDYADQFLSMLITE
jgi:hypothetical protein